MNERQQEKPNNQCLDMGLLVGLRDDELSAGQIAHARADRATCPDWAADERGVASTGREVYDLLVALGQLTDEIPDSAIVFAAIHTRLDSGSEHQEHPETLQVLAPRYAKSNRRRRYGWLAAAAAAVLIALLLLPNAGALAYQFLALFSVQQFQPVSVDPQSFSSDLISSLRDFGNMQVQYETVPASMQHPTQAQVRQWIHFPLSLPSHLPAAVGLTLDFPLASRADGTRLFHVAKLHAYP